MLYTVGLDIGYYATKVFTGGKTTVFPSVLAPVVDEELISLSRGNEATFMVKVGTENCFVGNSALSLSKNAKRREARNYHLSNEWYTLFLASLTEAGIPSGATLVIGTGLPASFYSKEAAKELREVLNGRHEITRHGQTYIYHVAASVVSSQFYGAATAAVTQGHEIARYLQEPRHVAVADGGGRTWNFGVLAQMQIVGDSTFSVDLGSWSVLESANKVFTRLFGFTFTSHEIMEALETGRIYYGGDYEDVAEYTAKILDELATPVLQVFSDRWEKVLGTTSALYLTGGTPLLLGERLNHLHKRVFHGGQFDNAIGYHWLAEQTAAKKGLG